MLDDFIQKTNASVHEIFNSKNKIFRYRMALNNLPSASANRRTLSWSSSRLSISYSCSKRYLVPKYGRGLVIVHFSDTQS